VRQPFSHPDSTRERIGCSWYWRAEPAIKADMFTASKIGLVVALIAATVSAIASEPALAKKASLVRKQSPIFYSSIWADDVRCVDRSFSISVGNPAYRNRLSIWPAPCR
jgi:hypothetical protein